MGDKLIVSPIVNGLVKGIIEAENNLKEILDEFDPRILKMIGEYVIEFGKDFSPYGSNTALRDFKKMLNEQGYKTVLGYNQNSKIYQLTINRG